MLKHREIEVGGWEKIVHFEDDAAGLNAIIAVHDATLGPAAAAAGSIATPISKPALRT